ncbi:MAG: YihY/virulence factor BrkB family protein [Acidimicrobiales bacterium]
MANPVELVVRPLDRWQQRHRFPGFVFGVIKKYGDDRGGTLAALVTFYGFLALFPLLLVAFTVLGFVLRGHADWQATIETSALSKFPVIGPSLRPGELHGNTFALVVGLLGLLWGALGVTYAIQFAVNEAWDVPNKSRPPFFVRIARGLALFGVLGIAVLATTALTVLGSIVGNSWLAGALGLLGALALNVGLFLGTFRLLSPRDLSWRDLLPGAVVAGASWQLLQLFGQWLVLRNLRHAQQLYGQFALVLGLIFFLSIATQMIMYGVEVNVVRHKELWPRSIVQPPLLPADRKALALRAQQEARRPEQLVDVSWRPAADGEGE